MIFPQMPKTFYLTTAIDYTNGAPHIGHAYEKVLADAIVRFVRLTGRKAYFLSGLDQHGQKVQQSAEAAGIPPEQYVRTISDQFIALWKRLGVEYDGWAETTDPRHKRVVQDILQRLYDAGAIYKKVMRGFYSVRQEQFLTDRDRGPDGTFGPEWGRVEEREEENYYFRLSDHIDWLRKFLDSRPDFVFPPSRHTQLVNAACEPAVDLCISRPKSRLTWGIELPFDREFVTFVWFDALVNYISFAGYLDASPGTSGLPSWEELWPCDAHIIGKDILIPAHGIYWPIMLHAAGVPDEQMPRIVVHGWWNVSGEKMSKSLGNVIDPHQIADVIGADGLRYYLLADIATGQDSDMSEERVLFRYNKELADILGNLLNRTLSMARKYLGGVLPAAEHDSPLHSELRAAVAALPSAAIEHMKTWQIHRVISACVDVARQANEFIDRTAPFQLAKDPEKAGEVASIMRHVAETVTHLSVLLSPVIPGAAGRIQQQLNWSPPEGFTLDSLHWGLLPDRHALGQPEPVFPKVLPKED